MPEPLKFCVSCKFYRQHLEDFAVPMCIKTVSRRPTGHNLVTGEKLPDDVSGWDCETLRLSKSPEQCGADGKWFEPKP